MKLRSTLKGAAAPVALATVLAAAPAVAQENSDVPATAGESSSIIVTGTRLNRNPEVAGANPVVTLDAQTIERSGEINLTELLTETPALFNSEDNFSAAGSQARTGAAGVNLLDLRNLGAARTLVLVNGRRHIAGVAGEAAVDINTIPTALVERIDILTGGVSSVYGADGVSGVVNFIMQRDFEGVDFRSQVGISEYNDAESAFGALTVGTNFNDGRGNITGSYEYRFQGRVGYGDRPAGQFDAIRFVRNPDDVASPTGDDPNIPDYIPLPYIGYAESSPAGALILDDSLVPVYRGDGALYNGAEFLPNSGFLSAGGPNTDDTPIADYQGDLQAETQHHIVNLFAEYELTPSIRFFAEGKYVNSENFTIAQPSFDFYTYVGGENPFIPDNVRQDIAANGGYFGGLLLNRDNFDLGTRDETFSRDVYRGVVGFDGDITDNLRFEVSYVYGKNDTTYVSDDQRVEDRYFASLDAVDEGEFLTGTPNGNVVCRVSVDGSGIVDSFNFNYGEAPQTFSPDECVPLNVFGENVASQAALDFVFQDLTNTYTLTQDVVTGFVSGDFGRVFELPGGPVAFVLGGEYRKETSTSIVDPLSKQVTDFDPDSGVLADLALLADETGEFDVIEGFAELSVPLLADMPFFELLELTAAVRLSDYSLAGYTDSWSFSGIWAPVDDIRFRGSYSKATRAPNITELFAPATGTFSFIDDPCDPINVGNGTSSREANCRTLIEGLGADFDTYDYSSDIASSASIEGFFSGNQNLNPEEATTWTAGVVLEPRFLDNFAISFDWYDIDLSQAINTTTLTELAEFCVDAPTLDNQFCPLVDRAQGTGFVEGFRLSPVNVAFFETAGADMTVRYRTDLGADTDISFRGTVGYLDKLLFVPADGGEIDDDKNEIGAPEWNGNADVTLTHRNFSLNYGVQYIGEQQRYANDVLAANPDRAAPEYLYIDEVFIHDIRGEVKLADERMSVFVGVNNFTDEGPALGSINTPTGWRGRYYYTGLRMTLDGLFN
ncbi:TonB-dependent receptor plug domain-containing protein [Aurantiacibacter poecillastricola]|uniref:TonB-dependent receptor plug domain-containing protein n=1 Tax=Aurantiacibacter poecillastricola TaxID=3064385 RepID=UPI00273FABAB|nr:TonB-dependent receptor [Aurantiacibacter sp. 219JJ12-13]MDP5262820.1 TonB-dependent receptor [Aurantiacibacter sp. 219JJ12-13]